jgi:hypothetical protein
MFQLTLRARGPASPEVVWQRYAEPKRWTTWSPQIRGVVYPYRRLRPGTGGRVHGPVGLTVVFLIDAVDEDRRTWSWTISPRVAGWTVARLRLHHVVSPARPTGSATTLRLCGRAPVVLAYAPVASIALRRLVS